MSLATGLTIPDKVATVATETVSRAPKTSQTHLPALDGVRGLAIVLVMFHHLSPLLSPHNAFDRALTFLASCSWVGVDLFFVLSGFLITGILWDSRQSPTYFRTFYARRAVRIFPLYYLMVALYFFAFPHIPGIALDVSNAPAQAWYWSYLTNFAFAVGADNIRPVFLVSWSLCIEEQFYLLWPLIVWRANRRVLVTICAALLLLCPLTRALLVSAGASWHYTYMLTPCRVDGLAAGALLAVFYRSRFFSRPETRPAAFLTLLASIAITATLFLGSASPREDALTQVLLFSVLAVGFTSAIALLIASPNTPALRRARALFESPTLRMFGRYSYGLYLLHGIVIRAVEHPLSTRVNLPTLWGSNLLAQSVYWAVTFGLSVIVAALSWHLFEKHFLKLKRYFPSNP